METNKCQITWALKGYGKPDFNIRAHEDYKEGEDE